ncbi:MAG: type IV pilus twitching motility protein PilT [Vicinamibacterales bacterium]
MTLVQSLLQAIVLMDGEALVLHVGDRPYVVSQNGQISLAKSGMTKESIAAVIRELLPPDSQRALREVGATQCVLPHNPQFSSERFVVVAARGGDDMWVEIRREERPFALGGDAGESRERGFSLEPAFDAADSADMVDTADAAERSDVVEASDAPDAPDTPMFDTRRVSGHGAFVLPPFKSPALETPHEIEADTTELEPLTAVVLPLTRTPLHPDAPPPLAEPVLSGIDRLLRLAAARGASTLYLSSGAQPSIRLDGEVRALDGAAVLGPNEVESLLLTLMPERGAEALRSGAATEWTSEFADLGRVRCVSFRDHRGPGGVFRMMSQRAVTTDQLGLSREILGLIGETDGVILVTGPRLNGKRTLMSACVDHINRTRRVHVITVEQEIHTAHERAGSIVSQREARGADDMIAVARSALREDPDVLVLEDVHSPALVDLVLQAAASGRLVICGFTARSATAAIDGIIDLFPSQEQPRVRLGLAQQLRGVVAQVLLKKTGGGRLAARELLLNTPAVASLLAEGKTSQLPLAIEGARKNGMVPLNDALGGFVQSGAADVREAYRCSPDRPGLLALLQRQGIDVSALERLA